MEWLKQIFGIEYIDVNQFLVRMGTNLLISIVILVAGFYLAKFATKAIKKVLKKSNTDEGLVTFISSFSSMVMKILVVITAITQLGIEMTSFVALLGAAGLAIGMAFSGTLSNFAGGIMILVLKPFKVGDMILTQGEQGVVKEIQIFNTYLHTGDNKVIILPNGAVANGNITNFTKADMRRVDWSISIAYGDDAVKAKNTLLRYAKDDKRILQDPETFVGVMTMANSSVDLVMRAWVKTDDYWPVYFEMNEKIYHEFPKEGFNFPFPQMDVHLKKDVNV
jgi:small conductance mechanosensitive channel